MNKKTNIVFDIGGMRTRVARVVGEELEETYIFDTPKNPKEGLPLLVDSIRKVAGDCEIDELCGDMSGIVKNGIIYISPNLPEWNGTHIVRELQKAFDGAPTRLFNDAELVALGEYFYGAGKDESNIAFMTVSTGVGAVHVLNGAVDRGQYNAEIGHSIIDDGLELEELISGTAVAKKFGIHPKDLSDKNELEKLADYLALGLYNLTLFWSPKVIVLGGSMITGNNPIPLKRTQETLTTLVSKYYPDTPEIRKATLGDQGGLYGGVANFKMRIH